MNRLRERWERFTARERVMVATMLAAVAVFAVAYGLVLPLHGARDDARERHARATADAARIEAAARRIERARREFPQHPSDEALVAAVVDAAGAAGVAVSRRDLADDVLAVGIDATGSPALLAWLDALRTRHGIVPRTLQVAKRDGRLQVEARFDTVAP